MGIFRKNFTPNIELARQLQRYGGVGGANVEVERFSREQLAKATRDGGSSMVARIYAPTTLRLPSLPYDASLRPNKNGMIDRLYETAKKATS
jgi:hypothetical protein